MSDRDLLLPHHFNTKNFAERKDLFYYAKLALFCALLLLFGVGNNVGGAMMSFTMPFYPVWIVYFTTILYTIVFVGLAILTDDNPFKSHHFQWVNQKYYIGLAVLTALSGLMFQFSAAWVQPDLAQVLTTAMILQLPVFEFILFKERRKDYNFKSIFYLLVIFGGIVVGSFEQFRALGKPQTGQEQSNDWYWIVCLLLATTALAGQQTLQDISLHDPKARITGTSSLAWMNAYSIPFYFFSIFFECIPIVNGKTHGMTLSEAFSNQKDAFHCFFGMVELSEACQKGATAWVLIYSACYVGLFMVVVYMMNKFGMVFPAVVGSNITLLASLAFTQRIIAGDHTTPFSWPIVTGCVMIILGVIGRGVPSKQDSPGASYTPIPHRSFSQLPVINDHYY